MPSLEASVSVMSKALESQKVMAEMLLEGGKVMSQNPGTNVAQPQSEPEPDISSAISGLGTVINMVV